MIKQFREERLGYFIIPIFVMSLYISIIASYAQYSSNILPSGDPFTYTLGFFRILDVAHNNYLRGLLFAFQSNFYWLINLMVALISPILTKEPLSISIVNYVIWGVATVSFYRLGMYLKLGFKLSLISSLILWLYPINFGFLDHTSISVLALDAMFIGILHVVLANVIIYSIDTKRTINAIIAGLSVGLAIWGRGNSPPVILLVILIPTLVILYNLYLNRKNRKILINCVLFGAIILFMGFIYYYNQFEPIALYYKSHIAYVERHLWNLKDALPFILNVPGFFFWRVENSFVTISVSLLLHTLVIISLLINYRKIILPSKDYVSFLAVIGAFIYFATYIINIVLFTDPIITLQNCLLIYAPMRIGLALCLMSILVKIIRRNSIVIPDLVLYAFMGLIILYGSALTRKLTPKIVAGRPTPADVESFSIKLDEIVKEGTLSILWYANYNSAIINYYRRKNNLAEIPIYSYKYYNDIWVSYDYTENKRMKVREEIAKHFEEASIIIIPEHVDYYDEGSPYSLYKFKDEIPKYLNSQKTQKFVVRMVLKENGGRRLLVLQRESESRGMGEMLRIPYGKSNKLLEAEYGGKVDKPIPKNQEYN